MPRKPTLSPTRIGHYLVCAMKFCYIYLDKLGRYYLRAHPALSFGSSMHQVLQRFHSDGATGTAEAMSEDLEKRWIGAGYETPEQEAEYRAAGAEMVQTYHAALVERQTAQIETLYTEKNIRTDMGPFILAGRVDRVDRHPDDTLEIIDYKSGRWETTPEEVAGDLAMRIYQLILRRNHPGTRVIATIYCLRSGTQASAEMSDADAEQFAHDITVLGEEILGRDLDAVEPVHIEACEECEFRSLCERFWRKQRRVTSSSPA